jgi:hypothetical protein
MLQARIVDASAQPKLNDQPHVLYLRSFNKDDIAARLKGDRTEEEHLALLLGYIGPVVAIGRPEEPLPNVSVPAASTLTTASGKAP